jgi:hypothetical protein
MRETTKQNDLLEHLQEALELTVETLDNEDEDVCVLFLFRKEIKQLIKLLQNDKENLQ